MKICVVGSGTAGLVSALILKTRFPNYQVDIVCSKRIGIVGVGEGSTEHWENFAAFVGINTAEMIKACDATFKIGILFKDWGVPDYMHSIQDGYNGVWNKYYPYVYANLISQGVDSRRLSGEVYWENNVQEWFIKNNQTPVAQYHFNTFKLNEFLTNIATSRGINVIHDEITDVVVSNDNEIVEIVSKDASYKYDFYIDCTGFKKFLISKLGGKWVSHKEFLKTDSALVFQTDDTENYNMWSLAKAMKYGWLFRTPTWGRWGNGYIYDSEFITPEQAQAEIEEELGQKIIVGQHIKFDPGAINTPWISNCCAIGLSSSFVEPLEASSIGASIQQSFLLAFKIVNYNQNVIDKYNKTFNNIIQNIRDFIVLHFICPRRDTEFWKKVAEVKLPPSLEEKLNAWRNKMPTEDDFDLDSNYILFKSMHFLMIVHGLQLFDIESIKREFDTIPEGAKEYANQVLSELEYGNRIDQPNLLTHKQMLEIIRDNT